MVMCLDVLFVFSCVSIIKKKIKAVSPHMAGSCYNYIPYSTCTLKPYCQIDMFIMFLSGLRYISWANTRHHVVNINY